MAPEVPLILRFCEFENLEFICSPGSSQPCSSKMLNSVQFSITVYEHPFPNIFSLLKVIRKKLVVIVIFNLGIA